MLSTNKAKKAKFGKVRVTKAGASWLVDFYDPNPDTRYLPPNPREVARQVRQEKKREREKVGNLPD